jgi:hypothetical protein
MESQPRTGFAGLPVFSIGFRSAVSYLLPSGFLAPIFALALLIGCASPSEPLARKALIPEAVADLVAVQSGNDVVLTFTLPKDSVDHRPLGQTPTIEIYRDIESPSQPGAQIAAPANPTLLATIPAAVTTQYADQAGVRYADALAPSAFGSAIDRTAVYVVRTRVSAKHASANSNVATLRIFPAPEPVADLKAEVTHSGINLTWTPPEKDLAGNRPAISGYRIYRTVAPSAAAAAPEAKTSEKRMTRIAEVDAAAHMYLDAQINFGDTYSYSVRSVAPYPGEQLESADSNLEALLAKDTFPPAAPENVVLATIPAQPDAPGHLELSWQISPEPDVAGYNIYRSDQSGVMGTRQNAELLPTPAFRDMNVVPGKRYFYTATAVDRSGNESSPSTAISGEALGESQLRP